MALFRPINDDELLRELDQRCHGYGNGVRTAGELGIDPIRLREIKSGSRRINAKVAGRLGYELRWIKRK